jgi:tetratricopeptide (TPR) repeat protein
MQGTRIGQYELQRVLGRGAFGEVWLAQDHRLGRQVAIKQLKAQVLGDPDVLRRFDSEAEYLLKINEPHVVRVLDRIEIEGAPALVTEYMEGGSLSDLKRKSDGPFATEDIMRWCEQAALGLSAIHGRGILHRDIKPANLFLSQDGNLSLGDFGLARSVDMTQTMGLQGTMPYMSPEQIRGLELDARSDLFALGVSIYELLTGIRPFGDGLDRTEKIPSARSIRAEVPALLSDTVDALLEVDVEKRVQSAEELLARLRGQAAGRQFSLPSNRRLVVAAVAVMAVAVGLYFGRGLNSGPQQSGYDLDAPIERRVVMLPFEYRGDPKFERLGTEIPTLVATRLDGVANISAPPPELYRDDLIDPLLFATDEVEMVEWMEKHQARLVVHGVITEISGQLRIDLSFRRQVGQYSIPGKTSLTLTDAVQILPAVNDVGMEVLRQLLVESSDDLAGEVLVHANSFEAMCAYLQGHQAPRRASGYSKDMEKAVKLDSTMALAYYELSWLAEWNGLGKEIERQYLAQARRYEGQLGPYGSLLLESAEKELDLDIDGAEAVLMEAVTTYPNKPWAWLRLAQLHYNHNVMRGRSWMVARRELERVRQLDPHNLVSMALVRFIYAAEGDDAAIRSLLGDEPDRGGLSVLAFTSGSRADRDSIMTNHSPCGEGFAFFNLLILLYPDNHRNIIEFLEPHLCAETKPADRAWNHLTQAHLYAGLGRWQEARRQFAKVPETFGPFQLEYGALALSLPFVRADEQQIREMIGALDKWRPLEESSFVDPEQFGILAGRFNPHIGVHEQIRQYCLAALYARLGEISLAEAAIERIRTAPAKDDVQGFVGDLVAMGQGRIEMAAGDHAAALTHFDRIQPYRDLRGGYSSFFQRGDARFLRAQCLAELGRHEEALGWFESADQNIEFLLIYSAFAHFEQAKSLEALGQPLVAAARYRDFLSLMEDCDPEYVDMVAQANERVRVLEPEG